MIWSLCPTINSTWHDSNLTQDKNGPEECIHNPQKLTSWGHWLTKNVLHIEQCEHDEQSQYVADI